MGSGACFFDFDGDGLPDLYIVQSGQLPAGPRLHPSALYRNNGDGTFTDVTEKAGVAGTGYGMGCACADYDADGDLDLYVTNFGPNVLYRNEGNGTFTDVTERAGVGDPRWGASAVWADLDGDGWLDLFVTNYLDFSLETSERCGPPDRPELRLYCHPRVFPGVENVFYRNNGDGTFSDRTVQAGLATREGKGLGVVATDYDDDGDTDLYVANDSVRNFLYRNRGDGTFEEVGLLAGVAYDAEGRPQAGMGVDAGDWDRDGDFDLFVTNFRREDNTLYRNEGRGRFSDATAEAGLARASFFQLGFGTNFFDADLDGWLDLYVANGDIEPHVALLDPEGRYAQPDQIFRNDGRGRFFDVSATAGPFFERATVSRGLALADVDEDGDLDALVTSSGGRAVLLRNDSERQGLPLVLALEADPPNRNAVGAKVSVRTERGEQIEEVRTGTSYLSQNDLKLVFGIEPEARATVTVRWPGGRVDAFEGVRGGALVRIRQGQGIVERRNLRPERP